MRLHSIHAMSTNKQRRNDRISGIRQLHAWTAIKWSVKKVDTVEMSPSPDPDVARAPLLDPMLSRHLLFDLRNGSFARTNLCQVEASIKSVRTISKQ